MIQHPRTSLQNDKQCMSQFYLLRAFSDVSVVVSSSLPTFIYALTIARRWIRPNRQKATRLATLVSLIRISHLPRRTALRSHNREPQLPKPRLWIDRSSLWLYFWVLSIPCRGSIWCAWLESKLGNYDPEPNHQWEYLQYLLWFNL
jgi:hypothetical protein